MCGIFGGICSGDCCNIVPSIARAAVAMDYGHERLTSAMVFGGDELFCHSSKGPAINAFNGIDPDVFMGKVGLGHDACQTGMGLVALRAGNARYALSVDATSEVTQRIIEEIDGDPNFERAIERVMSKVEEPFALVLAHQNGLIGARNQGRKPLTYGEIIESEAETDDVSARVGYYIASQSCVLGGAGRFISAVSPGEMVIIEKGCKPFCKVVIEKPDKTRCVMEILFQQRPDNIAGSQEIGSIRQLIGLALGQKLKRVLKGEDHSRTLAVSIPAGGNFFLYGLARAGFASNSAAIIKSIYPKGKIALLSGMRGHYNYMTVPAAFDGITDVIIVNDMIRTGATAGEMSEQIGLIPGVKNIHLAVAGVTRSSCPYRSGAYTFEGEPGIRTAETLGVDTLTCLTPAEIVRAIGNPQHTYCTQCLKCTRS